MMMGVSDSLQNRLTQHDTVHIRQREVKKDHCRLLRLQQA